MHNRGMIKTFFILLIIVALATAAIILTSKGSVEGEVRVAVASNFREAIKDISARFETKTGNEVTLIFGSTGSHYAQIVNGAPFDIFLAADSRRPELLEKNGIARERFTYAVGKLVLWSPQVGFVDPGGVVLDEMDFHHLAIANPELAPYGRAAEQVLQARGIWDKVSTRLVYGENINQTFQFVFSGNAELGFVAYSHVKQWIAGSWWEVPQVLYSPIEQQAVLLKDSEISRAFLAFLRTDEAQSIIRNHGYDTP